jgi:hypothetical protein
MPQFVKIDGDQSLAFIGTRAWQAMALDNGARASRVVPRRSASW